MIIDFHTHPMLDEPKKAFESMEKILKAADKFGIEKICSIGCFPMGFDPDSESIEQNNTIAAELAEAFPDRIIPFCFLNPNNGADSCLETIERFVVDKDFAGIKLEVEMNCRNRDIDPIMERVLELGKIVVHHSWYKTTGKIHNESAPSDIADLAGRFPDLKIIMAHLTGVWMKGIMDIEKHPNVYVDTSGAHAFSGIVEYAVKRIGADRIIYGSDAYLRGFASQLGRIYGAEITNEDREKILYGNACKLLEGRI